MTDKEVCDYCGNEFKKVAQHLPHCPVYKLQKEADESIQDLKIEPKKSQEITVPGSSTAAIIPDKFWAWTAGMGVQLGAIIGSLNDIKSSSGNIMKLLREQLFALNSGMADQLTLLQEIVDYEKLRIEMMSKVETKIENITAKEAFKANVLPEATKEAFKTIPSKAIPTEAEMAEEFEEIQQKEAKAKEVKSYKEDITLPENTRQLDGKITIVTEKAFQILFENGKECWLPKSTVHGNLNNMKSEESYTFVIDSWVLKKNGVIGEDD